MAESIGSSNSPASIVPSPSSSNAIKPAFPVRIGVFPAAPVLAYCANPSLSEFAARSTFVLSSGSILAKISKNSGASSAPELPAVIIAALILLAVSEADAPIGTLTKYRERGAPTFTMLLAKHC